jgi:hypothetical protein
MEEKNILDQMANQVLAELSDNPGASVAVDPDVADHMGAFAEDALTPEEAEDASFDPEVVHE